jgi:uncharacterized RDD family membrane protein YckC
MKTTNSSSTLTAVISALLLLAGMETRALPQADDAQKPDATAQAAAADQPPAAGPESETQPSEERSRPNFKAKVVFGQNATLKSNEVAEAVIVIGGSAKIYGKVRDAVVAIGGDVEVYGEVGDAAVAVLGNVKVAEGAKIGKDVVTVGGNLDVGKGADIGADVVAVGGKLDVAEGAEIGGDRVEVPIPMLVGLRNWVKYCLFRLRPLAPEVGWVWAVTGVFFLLYLLVTVLFPSAVGACVKTLTVRPATTFFMGLLTKLLAPIVMLLLLAVGIGVFVVPFVWIALLLGALFGKAAFAQFIGLRIGQQLKLGALAAPLAAFLLGSILIVALYMVPVLGLIAFGVISVWGLGAAVTATFAGLRREIPPKPTPPTGGTPAPVSPWPATAAPPAPAMGTASPLAGEALNVSTATVAAPAPEPAPASATPPPVPASRVEEALQYPRAGFWERLGAAFLDVVLVSLLSAVVHGPPWGFLIALAYFAGMWTWKGTTIGGIVLNLKVVRLDGQPVNFAVGLVRGLAAAFSIIVFFLGFLWMIWDKDKQTWHDKIAGTVVVRLPRGVPLVCF